MKKEPKSVYYYENYLSKDNLVRVMAYVLVGNYNMMTNRLEGHIVAKFGVPSESFAFVEGGVSVTSPHIVEVTLKNIDNLFEFIQDTHYVNHDRKDKEALKGAFEELVVLLKKNEKEKNLRTP